MLDGWLTGSSLGLRSGGSLGCNVGLFVGFIIGESLGCCDCEACGGSERGVRPSDGVSLGLGIIVGFSD